MTDTIDSDDSSTDTDRPQSTEGEHIAEIETGFVVSACDDGWAVTHCSGVSAEVGYTITQSDGRAQRVTVECVFPTEDDKTEDNEN